MKEQFRRGRLKFISFIIIDLFCLVMANALAVKIYFNFSESIFDVSNYAVVVAYMAVIDIIVIIAFNTLNRVLRRNKKKEIVESVKHVGISIVILALILFSTKQGAEFSRLTIYLAYAIYFILIILCRSCWKTVLRINQNKKTTLTALLITTVGYANEGINAVESAGMNVKGMFITDKTNEGLVGSVPVIVDFRDAEAFLCWEWIDKVYICGPVSIDVPESVLNACKQMEIPVYTAPSSMRLDYEVIKIRTALQKNDNSTGLSFIEGEHDIPFRISSFYTIFESEQDNQRGFHAHKQSWHLLFCPYGYIDVMIDTGKERKAVILDSPSIGLILHPSIWREIYWKKKGSVLCVAASGHYDADKLSDDYNEYLKFIQEKEWSATIESAEIMGDIIV